MAHQQRWTSFEARIDTAAQRLLAQLPEKGLTGAAVEFLVFGLKQGWACLFGGLFLAIVLASAVLWPAAAPLHRYDFLFGAALAIQLAMLAFRLEQPAEAVVIFLFHAVGTGMELFKTAHGSWAYPESSLLHIGGVPLFSGFMYAAVGSYIARAARIFDFRFRNFPPLWACGLLAIGIYANFFADQYGWDFRLALFAATALLFWRTPIYFRVFRFRHHMPLLLGFGLVALFIWLGENIGTWSKVWLYPSQRHAWAMVAIAKFGSWYLLMIVSFVLVSLVHRPQALKETDQAAA